MLQYIDNLSNQLIKELSLNQNEKFINIISSYLYPHLKNIEKFAKNQPNLHFTRGVIIITIFIIKLSINI